MTNAARKKSPPPPNPATPKTVRPCVALGVTGSVAAFKAAALTSALVKAGIEVQVLMTAAAAKLVQPQTFQTLSRLPVITSLWELPDWKPGHIALADRARVLVIAPATANTLAKLANGIADDALSTYAVSHGGPLLVAPAMNPRMWRNAAVQDNVRRLRERGVRILGPGHGPVACGDEGDGRMLEPEPIAHCVLAHLAVQDAGVPAGAGRRVVITAGPTHEAWDPVRFLGNRSSGKMGYALAAAAAAAGLEVTLVSGPTHLPPPALCRFVPVESAAEMAAAVRAAFAGADFLVMAAAVADFRPAQPAGHKIKKTAAGAPTTLPLTPTEDILAAVAAVKKPGQRIMGFAAETNDLADHARQKLRRKKVDWIVANDVSRSDIGFGAADNAATVFAADGAVHDFPKMDKLQLAARLLGLLLG